MLQYKKGSYFLPGHLKEPRAVVETLLLLVSVSGSSENAEIKIVQTFPREVTTATILNVPNLNACLRTPSV